jgi:hypothetical protein
MSFEFRFYNAGQRICEKLSYDNPLLEARTSNLIAYYQLDAPEKGFFSVPRELETASGGRFSVPFDKSVLDKYGKRGIVLIDKNLAADDIAEDSPLAATDVDAKRKAEKFWLEFLKDKAQEWLDHCAMIRQAGGNPKPAAGFHKFAMETLGIQDPGATIDNVLSTNAGKGEVAELKALVAELTKRVNAKS